MNNDKQTEFHRYESHARQLLASSGALSDDRAPDLGSSCIAPVLRAPYLCYEQYVGKFVKAGQRVLEVGSGTGAHSHALLETGAFVVCTDISCLSLRVLERGIGIARNSSRPSCVVADMEILPFENASFDVVATAGSLSYGEPDLVDAEIRRVLRRGGTFICVDSLNHNPVYRLNRWLHYLAGSRTKSTLDRMPTVERIERLAKGFGCYMVWYFGAVSYLSPLLASVFGQDRTSRMSDAVDRLVKVRKSAFKFVLVAVRRS